MAAFRSEAILHRLEPFGMRLGLGRVRRLLAALGDPQLALPTVLVAGTNGKGSTAALLAAICRAAGVRTGLYTSPHLESVTERLVVDGLEIADAELAGHLVRGLAVAAELASEPPTYFEALTLAAFSHFRDAGVELAVMEVGLGGRLDATNAGEPVLSIVTSIALDHQEHLGSTLAEVAREKIAVSRRGRPAIVWADMPEVEAVVRRRAAAAGAQLVLARRQVGIEPRGPAGPVQRLRLTTAARSYELELHLAGRHQLRNLASAVLAAESLAAAWPSLDAGAVAAGAASCRWPGRLEWVDLPDRRRLLLDAAHNAAGLVALVDYLGELEGPPDLLFGALAEKTIDAELPRLAAAVGRVVLTRPPQRRAAEPERWRPGFEGRPVVAEPDLGRALDRALEGSGGTLLVCGSIYLVGRVRGMLRQRFGVPD